MRQARGCSIFLNNPNPPAWNAGALGVADLVNPQLGQVPSAANSAGMLVFNGNGGQFRLFASGVASSIGTPTVTPIIQIVTPNVTTGLSFVSPVYSTFLDGNASGALTANKPLAFSISADLTYDPSSGTLSGFQEWTHTAAASGSGGATQICVALTAVTGLVASSNGPAMGGFGFVIGVTFSTAVITTNTASLFEFKIAQS